MLLLISSSYHIHKSFIRSSCLDKRVFQKCEPW